MLHGPEGGAAVFLSDCTGGSFWATSMCTGALAGVIQCCDILYCKLTSMHILVCPCPLQVISTTASGPGGLQVGLAAPSTHIHHNGWEHVKVPIGRVLVMKKCTLACRDELWSTFSGLEVLCATSRNGQGMG